MLRWWVLSWVVLVSCKSDNSIGCGKTNLDPADLGPQPGFVPVAHAPAGIEQVILDGSGRPVVRARDGLHRYDGNGAWTAGPAMSTIRLFHGADREISIHMDGNYGYVAREKTKVYGFRSDDVAPSFIESAF